MKHFDIFNGDADGICALHQLRLADPLPSPHLITGVKRNINLLQQVPDAEDATLTVLDISLDKNRFDLERLLTQVKRIEYIDHHYSGDIPESGILTTHIDPDPETCTSLIVDNLLNGAYTEWALAGAFGDNLDDIAITKGRGAGLSDNQLNQLQEIGRLLNYNGYGFTLEDLYIHPARLFEEVHTFTDPFVMYRQSEVIKNLQKGYSSDIAETKRLTPYSETAHGRIFLLPNAPWSRRIVGVFSNQIAREQPDKAHATAIINEDRTYRISVRAPLQARQGADFLCRRFPTGGGRAGAAGINALPEALFDEFQHAFFSDYSTKHKA